MVEKANTEAPQVDSLTENITPVTGNPEKQDNATEQADLQKLQELQKQLEEDFTLKGIRKETRVLKREVKKLGKTGDAMQKLNKITYNKVLLTLDLEDRKNFNKYLKDVIDHKINPAEEKFKPQNEDSFVAMLQQMPYLCGYVQFKNRPNISLTQEAETQIIGIQTVNLTQRHNHGSGLSQNIDVSNTSGILEAGKEKGLRGILKKTFDYMPNMTENQKNGWTNALFLGGMGYGLFKLGKRFFTDKKVLDANGKRVSGTSFLERIGIIGGVFLGSNMLTGKSPIELIDKAVNGGMSREYLKGNRGKSEENATELAKERVYRPLNATILLGKNKVSDLGLVLDENFRIKDYDVLLAKAKAENDKKSIEILTRIGKEDKENEIKKGLMQMGITPENQSKLGDKTIDDINKIYRNNISKAEDFRKTNNLILNTEDLEKSKKYDALISSGKEITDDDLKKLVEEGVLYEEFEIKKDSNREQLKNKVNKLEEGKSLKIKIDKEDAELSKVSGISEVELKSKGEQITKINLDLPSIKGLGEGLDDRKFTDKKNNGDIYSTILYAHKFNGFKNKFENRHYAAGSQPFELKDGKIYFNESKTGGGINQVEVMDDGIILGLLTDFPEIFKGQEQQIVNYLSDQIKLSSQTLEEVVKGFTDRNMDVKLTNNNSTLESHGNSIKIDVANKKIDGLDRKFRNYLDLIGAANLINAFKKVLKDAPAQSKSPIYIGLDGNIAFNNRTTLDELKSIRNRGANGLGDIDVVQSGDITFRKENSLNTISPTLFAHRKEFVQYLNKVSGFQEYVPVDKEAIELQRIKKAISDALNDGISPKIEFESGMTYDKEKKKLTIKGINEKNIQNDKLIENLEKLNNQVSWYNLLQSEYVDKVELTNVDIKPGETISVKYLKKLLDLDEKKIQLGPDMLANKEMIKYVIDKKYSEGRYKIEENTNLDMNGIVILKYIYENGYDFDRLFNGEDDSRLDFTMRVMQLLSEGQTIIDPDHKKDLLKIKGAPITLKPNHDPILERRRMSIKENINYANDIRGIKNRFYTARNDNILEKIAKYYNESYPNIADRQD